MRDYTYEGTPVSQMTTEDIHDCLRDGIYVCNSDGYSDPADRVILRLELELYIRRHNLRAEV